MQEKLGALTALSVPIFGLLAVVALAIGLADIV
jgi:hypothetical protein